MSRRIALKQKVKCDTSDHLRPKPAHARAHTHTHTHTHNSRNFASNLCCSSNVVTTICAALTRLEVRMCQYFCYFSVISCVLAFWFKGYMLARGCSQCRQTDLLKKKKRKKKKLYKHSWFLWYSVDLQLVYCLKMRCLFEVQGFWAFY